MGEVINYTYQELLIKTHAALTHLLTNIRIHEAYVQAMAQAGVITEEEAKEDHNHMVESIIDFLKKEHESK